MTSSEGYLGWKVQEWNLLPLLTSSCTHSPRCPAPAHTLSPASSDTEAMNSPVLSQHRDCTGFECRCCTPQSKPQPKKVNYSTVHYTTVQCITLQYSTVKYSAVQISTVPYNTVK